MRRPKQVAGKSSGDAFYKGPSPHFRLRLIHAVQRLFTGSTHTPRHAVTIAGVAAMHSRCWARVHEVVVLENGFLVLS